MAVYRSPDDMVWITKYTNYDLDTMSHVQNTVTIPGKEGCVIELRDISLYLWNESAGHVASACFTVGLNKLVEIHTASAKAGKTYGNLNFTGEPGEGIDLDFNLKTSYGGSRAMLRGVVFAYDYAEGVEEDDHAPGDTEEGEEEETVNDTIVKISCTSETEADELVKKLKENIPESKDVFISYVNQYHVW